jgi:hypothetical protein
MNIRYTTVVATAEDNLSCHCDTEQDAHHEDNDKMWFSQPYYNASFDTYSL